MADDLGHIFQGQRLHIYLIGDDGIRHDGGGIGVAQDNLVSFFLQDQAGLRAGIIEFSGLSDDDGTRANDQNFLDISSLRHKFFLPCTIRTIKKRLPDTQQRVKEVGNEPCKWKNEQRTVRGWEWRYTYQNAYSKKNKPA